MIIKAKDKNGNLIEFNPRGGRYRYKVNGEPKKGVTSLIGERSGKGALMWWSENCVYEALNYKFKVDGKAIDFAQQFIDDLRAKTKNIKEEARTIGTNLHKLAEDYITKKTVITPETEPLKTMFKKFKAYWDRSGFQVIAVEKSMYSPDLDVCGTLDLLVSHPKWKGKKGILDIKTSKDFYFDMPIQLETYKKLCEDSSEHKIDYIAVLNVPKEPAKDVSLRYFKMSPKYLKAFKACKYLNRVEEDFKKRSIEYNQIRSKKNGK